MARDGATVQLLPSLTALPEIETDQWTAAILLLHEHEWEPLILPQLLTSDIFYLGAMGSRIVHSQRVEKLQAMGFEAAALEKISAPIGLIPSMRDPETLAVSIIAQIIDRYNRNFLAF